MKLLVLGGTKFLGRHLVEDLLRLRARQQEVVLVSSGAIALGRRELKLPSGPLALTTANLPGQPALDIHRPFSSCSAASPAGPAFRPSPPRPCQLRRTTLPLAGEGWSRAHPVNGAKGSPVTMPRCTDVL